LNIEKGGLPCKGASFFVAYKIRRPLNLLEFSEVRVVHK